MQAQDAQQASAQLQSRSEAEASGLHALVQQLQQEQHDSRAQLSALLQQAAAASEDALPDDQQQTVVTGM